MSFQTLPKDENNRDQKSKKALESALRTIWLGKWFLFQTFEELDSIKDKELEAQQIRELLGTDPKTSETQ